MENKPPQNFEQFYLLDHKMEISFLIILFFLIDCIYDSIGNFNLIFIIQTISYDLFSKSGSWTAGLKQQTMLATSAQWPLVNSLCYTLRRERETFARANIEHVCVALVPGAQNVPLCIIVGNSGLFFKHDVRCRPVMTRDGPSQTSDELAAPELPHFSRGRRFIFNGIISSGLHYS